MKLCTHSSACFVAEELMDVTSQECDNSERHSQLLCKFDRAVTLSQLAVLENGCGHVVVWSCVTLSLFHMDLDQITVQHLVTCDHACSSVISVSVLQLVLHGFCTCNATVSVLALILLPCSSFNQGVQSTDSDFKT